MTPIPWQFSGPLNGSLRITFTGSGHCAQIVLSYQPSADTLATIAEQTANEITGAVFDVAPENSSVTERYQRLLGEIAKAETKIAELDNNILDLTAEQDAANAEAKPGLGKRLVRIGKKISAVKKQRDDLAYEADLLDDVAARARADAERVLLAGFSRQQATALGCLQARRSILERDLLAVVGAKLTSLIGVDGAILRLRAGSSMHQSEVRKLVDALPPISDGDDAEPDEETGEPTPEPQSQCEPVAA